MRGEIEPYDAHPTMLDAETPDEWLLAAYDCGWTKAHSNTANRVGLASLKYDSKNWDGEAYWPREPNGSYRSLGPATTNSGQYQPSDLFTQLMNEDLDTLSP